MTVSGFPCGTGRPSLPALKWASPAGGVRNPMAGRQGHEELMEKYAQQRNKI